MKTIKIQQCEEAILGGKGTILDRALGQGVNYPHQCRSGECGRCKSRLYSGEVKQLPCLDIALSPEEQQNNLILACRSVAMTDIELAWLDPVQESDTAKSQFDVEVSRIASTERVTLLSLRQHSSEPALEFKAGQYVDFVFPGMPARPYSMASLFGSGDIEFHIEQKGVGGVSHFVASKLRVGDRFRIEGPYGDAYYRDHESGPLLAVAAGTGLAPILAIVKASLCQSPERPVVLVYAEKLLRHQYMTDELRSLSLLHPALSLHLVVSRNNGADSSVGHTIPECLEKLSVTLQSASVYIAGSPEMVQTVATYVEQNGANPAFVRADAFTQGVETNQPLPSLLSRMTQLLSQLRKGGRYQQTID